MGKNMRANQIVPHHLEIQVCKKRLDILEYFKHVAVKQKEEFAH